MARGYFSTVPTKSGIREKLLAAGYVSGTLEYKAAYARAYKASDPEAYKIIYGKWREANRDAEVARCKAWREKRKNVQAQSSLLRS